MAKMLSHEAHKATHALRGGKRACECCNDFHTPKGRQALRQIQRRREAGTWKKDQGV